MRSTLSLVIVTLLSSRASEKISLQSTDSQSPSYASQNPKALLFAADKAADLGNHNEAINLYESALASNRLPTAIKSVVSFNLALSAKNVGAWPRARQAFGGALALLPPKDNRRVLIHRHLGEVCARLLDWKSAAEHFSLVGNAMGQQNVETLGTLKRSEVMDRASLFRSLGAAKLNAGDVDLAIGAFTQAYNLAVAAFKGRTSSGAEHPGPGIAAYSADLGVALALAERTAEAEGHLSQVRKTTTTPSFVAHRNLEVARMNAYVGLRLQAAAPALARAHLEVAVAAGIGNGGKDDSSACKSINDDDEGGAGGVSSPLKFAPSSKSLKPPLSEVANPNSNGNGTCSSTFDTSVGSKHLNLARAVYDRLGRLYQSQRDEDGSGDDSGSASTASHLQASGVEGGAGPTKSKGNKVDALVSDAVGKGVWRRADQRPGYLAPRTSLSAHSFWHDSSPSSSSTRFGATAPLPPPLALVVELLRGNASAIRAELVAAFPSLVAPSGGQAHLRPLLGFLGGKDHDHDNDSGDGSGLGSSSSSSRNTSATLAQGDDEHVADAGDWKQVVFVGDGRSFKTPPNYARGEEAGGSSALPELEETRNPTLDTPQQQHTHTQQQQQQQQLLDLFPVTSAVLRSIQEAAARKLPKGSMQFSVMSGGTHLRPHCGPTNHKLRIHLALVVPPPPLSAASPPLPVPVPPPLPLPLAWPSRSTGQQQQDQKHAARMRVGNQTRTWREGEVLVFDDSFEHEVWNGGDAPRAVLLLDVWHPELTEEEREEVRRDFFSLDVQDGTIEAAMAGGL